MAVTRIKNNQITDSTVVASSKLVSGSVTGALLANPLNYSGNLTITGNLIVNGTTTTVDTTNTMIADPVIVLSRGEAGVPSNDSGFLVKRGTSNNAAFLWDETNDQFVAITTTADGMTGGAITQTAFANLKAANFIATVGTTLGNIAISGNTISSSDTNGNVNIVPNGTGDVVLSADTVTIGDANATANLTTNGTGNLVLSTNNNVTSSNIQITQGANGNISITANGTGEIVLNTLAVGDLTSGRVTYAGTSGALVDNANLTFSGTLLTVTGNANVSSTANIGNLQFSGTTITGLQLNTAVTIAPNGTGNINATANTIVVGTSATAATVTTNGAGNLTLNTNGGTNSGTIRIVQGVNGNITVTPNGTGEFVASTIAVSDLTSGRVTYAGTSGALVDSANLTFSGTDLTVSGNIAMNGGVLTTTATTANVFNANATTLNIGGGATTATNVGGANGTVTMTGGVVETGALTRAAWGIAGVAYNRVANIFTDSSTAATTTVANNMVWSVQQPTLAASNLSVTYTTAATMYIANAPAAGSNVTITSPYALYIANGNAYLGNVVTMTTANATTVNATTVNANTFGSNGATSVTIANTTATTLNIGGAATTIGIGAATGTTTINNSATIAGNAAINGGILTTTATTANVFNANATTLNIGGAATTTNIGNSAGNVIVGGDFQVNGNDIRSSTGNVAITLNNTDVTIAGNLTVQGGTTSIGTQDLVVQDSIINLHTAPNLAALVADDGRDIGVKFHYYKTSDKHAFVGWANDTGYLEYYSDATESVGGTITGTYGTIKAASYVSTATTGTAPFTVSSTTLVANLRAATASVANTVADAAQPNITSVGTLTSLGVSGAVTASTFTSNVATGTAPFTVTSTTQVANLNVAASGTAVTVTAASQPNITSLGTLTTLTVDNIAINDNTISSTDTNGHINIVPNGTGDVYLSADNVIVGDLNTAVTITTNGTGGLFLSTNGGTSSSYLGIVQGVNGNINIVTNGTGTINATSNTLQVGTSATAATVTTNGAGNLTLSTNSGTNSGTIAITNGVNGNITITPNGTGNVTIGNLAIANNNIISTGTNANITLTPNGTGDVVLSADTVTIGDANATANLTTNGTGNLVLNTNGGTSSGAITIVQGANANITFTPNGTGEVVASTLAVSDLTSGRVTYAGTSGALVDSANLTFSGTQLTVTGSANVSSQANIANININGNTISSVDTNGNINITANGTGYVIVNSSADSSDFIVNGNTSVSATYANLMYVKASTGQIGIGTNSPATNVRIDASSFTDSVILTKGTTAQRPAGGGEIEGMLRYNTSTHFYEFWNGTAWTSTTASFTVIGADSFSGDNTTTVFTLSTSATSASVIVSINGVVQIPGSAYGVSGTTLTFTEAPLTGDSIDVRILTTTTTVTQIADLTTSLTVNNSAQRANTTVAGNLIVSVSNLAVLPGTDNAYNIGSGSARWKNVYATNTTILNADLAENYLADSVIEAATVVSFGGLNEVTTTNVDMDTKVAGVVSTAPAHIMNSGLVGPTVVAIALQGRTPVKVTGPVKKGDMMVSAGNGRARAEENPRYGSVIGKALEDHTGGDGVIEVVVGRL